MALLDRVLLLCLVVTSQACNRNSKPPNPDPTQPFPRQAQLDREGNYFLYWDANATHAVFEVHVRTKGWVGFGLSKNGGMVPADVMIGWVKDGRATITDRYADARYEPRLDSQQDWVLLLGQETEFGTILKFTRKLDTCDDKDFRIESGTTKVIFAFHPEDPVMRTGLCYHGSNRGTKALYLLDTRPIPKTLPADTQTVDFLNHNTLIPEKKTYYHCITQRFPEVSQKHHIIAFEPIIDNVDLTHHIVLYVCPRDFGKQLEGKEYECYTPLAEELRPLRQCISIFTAWAVGGDTLYLPEHLGIPLGDGSIPNMFVLETHYNNAMNLKGKRDNSGLRVHYTRSLRQYDASALTVGQLVDPISMIPPHFPNFVTNAYCPSSFTQQGLAKVANQEIKVVSAMLHTHLLGRKLIVRHFRGEKELPPIATDLNYDFDFQEYRLLNSEVVVKAGDVLVMECHYDSTGRSNITHFGLGTDNEMCMAFLLYYPQASLSMCSSQARTWEKYNISLDYSTFDNLQQLLSSQDWTLKSNRDAFQEVVSTADHWYVAFQRVNASFEQMVHKVGPPPMALTPYTPPASPTCAGK